MSLLLLSQLGESGSRIAEIVEINVEVLDALYSGTRIAEIAEVIVEVLDAEVGTTLTVEQRLAWLETIVKYLLTT